MAGKCDLAEPGKSLRMSETVVKILERSRTVLGATPSGKSRLKGDGWSLVVE
jgi:hypothetical protein